MNLESPSLAEVEARILERNAARPDPNPTCSACRYPFDPRDGGWLFAGICGTCESNRIEEMVLGLLNAKGRKAVKRALKDLKRLRKLPSPK
jgi:hypothetical protein